MNLKRILNLFLLVILSLFVISACADDNGSDDTSSRGSSIWDSVLSGGMIGGGSTGGTTGGTTDEGTDTESENTDTEVENTDTEDEGTTTEDEGNTDTEEEVVATETETDKDSNTDEGSTETEDDGTINNAFNVTEIELAYDAKPGGTTIYYADSSSGAGKFYHYDNNRLALSFDEKAQTLRIVGKIELSYERFTNSLYSMMNNLRYRYIDETISMDTVTFLKYFTDNGDGTYEFTYNFEVDGDYKLQYKPSPASRYIKFQLNNKTAFPSDVDAFVARDREMLPITAFYDPYSIKGTYEQYGDCNATVKYGNYTGATETYTNIAIDNITSNIDNYGNLEFTFNLDGFYYTKRSGVSNCFGYADACTQADATTGTSIDTFNSTHSLTNDVSSWWQTGNDPVTAGHLSVISKTLTYNNYKYLQSKITVTDPSGQDEKTGEILKLQVDEADYLNAWVNDYYISMSLTCYIQKVSDYVE